MQFPKMEFFLHTIYKSVRQLFGKNCWLMMSPAWSGEASRQLVISSISNKHNSHSGNVQLLVVGQQLWTASSTGESPFLFYWRLTLRLIMLSLFDLLSWHNSSLKLIWSNWLLQWTMLGSFLHVMSILHTSITCRTLKRCNYPARCFVNSVIMELIMWYL